MKKQFPLPTEVTEIVLIDVDPQCLHAYWHIAPEQQTTETHCYLRLQQAQTICYETQLEQHQGQCYIDNLSSHVRYQAELGYYDSQQHWQIIAHSNHIELPQAMPQLAYAFPQLQHLQINEPPVLLPPVTQPTSLLPSFPNIEQQVSTPPTHLLQPKQQIDAMQVIQQDSHNSAQHQIVNTKTPKHIPSKQLFTPWLGLSSSQQQPPSDSPALCNGAN